MRVLVHNYSKTVCYWSENHFAIACSAQSKEEENDFFKHTPATSGCHGSSNEEREGEREGEECATVNTRYEGVCVRVKANFFPLTSVPLGFGKICDSSAHSEGD